MGRKRIADNEYPIEHGEVMNYTLDVVSMDRTQSPQRYRLPF
jgi:hypothetical protein